MVLENLLVPAMTVVAGALTAIAAAAYRRTGTPNFLLLTAAFSLFLVKGAVLSAGLLLLPVPLLHLFLLSVGFDFAILALFFAYTLRR